MIQKPELSLLPISPSARQDRDPSERKLNALGSETDFWQWAFGDLRANNVRGIFAEWMVGRLLGVSSIARDGWADYDLLLASGHTVEVKASAYLQSWHEPSDHPSKIRFTGLRGNAWDPVKKRRAACNPTFNADVYVFCVQTELCTEKWDAFDLGQWEFYVLPRSTLEARAVSSISLSSVRALSPMCTGAQLRQAVDLICRGLQIAP